MTGWRHATAFMAVVALLLDAHTGVWAQGSNNRTNTFEQRFPPDQVPTPPAGEQWVTVCARRVSIGLQI
jgi:hypothetical protein